jgi:hypothetical protein
MMYRNPSLLKSAQYVHCVSCGNPNAVWCHSNQMIHGKGRGLKAHDIFGFYGCDACHAWFDGRSNIAPPSAKSDKFEWFREMWERSIIVACDGGYL